MERARVLGLGLVVALATGLYALHGRVFEHWLIDDTGISLAYARNLLRGHGLVAQPGRVPVEGYSNPLWVLVLAGVEASVGVGLPGTLKALALVLVGLGFAVLARLLARLTPAPGRVAAAALGFTALQTSFVIWCGSGLENPLHVLGVLLLVDAGVAFAQGPGGARAMAWVGLWAGVLVATRPEGFVYLGLVVLVWAARPGATGRELGAGLLGPVGVLGGLTASRLLYFGDVVPNTVRVKGGGGLANLVQLLSLHPDMVDKAQRLVVTLFGMAASNLFLALGVFFGARARERLGAGHRVVVGAALYLAGVYLLLPTDWMGEKRFATAFFPVFYAAFFLVLEAYARAAPAPGTVFGALAAVALLAALPDLRYRTLKYGHVSNIDLAMVRRAWVERFEDYRVRLGLGAASILLPDVGCMLLESRLTVHDFAGLCDRRIAAGLRGDGTDLREYVLGELRPTFMHVVDKWGRAADFARDPRFARDYVALVEYDRETDRRPAGVASGIYVRREAVAGNELELAAIRAEDHRLERFVPPLPPNPVREWLLVPPVGRPMKAADFQPEGPGATRAGG